MRQSATRELFAYWNVLRGKRGAPERAEIDPAAIRHILAETFMLEVDPEHKFPIRLSGGRINALFCAEQKRRAFVDLWGPHDARSLAAILATVVDATCPVIAGAGAAPTGYDELDELEIELLFLPLRHGGATNRRILGSLTTARKPPWLGLLPVEKLALRSLRIVGDSVAPLSGPISNVFQHDPSKASGPGGFQTHRHLRVFPGGRGDFC